MLPQVHAGPAGPSAAAAAAPTVGRNEDIEASMRQLELQGRPTSEDPGSSSGSTLGSGTTASSSDAGVSQSRASSSIRVAKFHKVLNEQLVSTALLQQGPFAAVG